MVLEALEGLVELHDYCACMHVHVYMYLHVHHIIPLNHVYSRTIVEPSIEDTLFQGLI